nr:DUF222 domain-containing protein [Actinomycetales bacterium]
MLSTADVCRRGEELRAVLRERAPAVSEAEAVDAIRLLEEVKSALAGTQAALAMELDGLRRAAEAAQGVPAEQRGRGVAAEIALARREAPSQGSKMLGLARALAEEMPHTRAALESGEISEWRATIVARETAWLSAEDRAVVDERLAPQLPNLGSRKLAHEARRIAQSLDVDAAVRHLERAESERRVALRPAPGSMAYLTALLPMAQAVAMYAALARDAEGARVTGAAEGRGKGQLMADRLVELVTGQERASDVPLEISLLISDASLLAGGVDPGWLPGHGPIPAEAARRVAGRTEGEVFLRRLYTAPKSGQLVAMDSRKREFTGELRKMILLRDDVCRTPWCDAPIRHADHAEPHSRGGTTSFGNGSGLCERCNYAKESSGWQHEADPRRLSVTTPTGHTYSADTPAMA